MNQADFISQALRLKPRQKWFSTFDKLSDFGWWGPFKTIDEAALECSFNGDGNIFIAQGRRLTKSEQESMGGDYEWEVEAESAFEIVLPKGKR